MKQKLLKISGVMSYISLFLIPIFAVLLVISFHSNLLITRTLSIVVYIALSVVVLSLVLYLLCMRFTDREALKNKAVRIAAAVFIVLCVGFIVLLYGPFSGFRNWLISTAMSTMSHQYYCKWFYSDEEIEKVQASNFVKEVDEKTDEELIKNKKTNFVEPLKNDGMTDGIVAQTDAYEIIKLTVNGQTAYLACVFDPSKVTVAYTNKLGSMGQYVTKMAELKDAYLGINGAGFYDPGACSDGGTPGGITIADGKIITDNGFHGYSGGGLIGFNKDDVLCLIKNITAEEAVNQGIRDAVSWGPFLVVNGKSSYVSGNGGWGLAARTAIGQRADGTVLLLVVDSNATRSKGADMGDLAKIMVNYGAVNAANLDGGTSTVMVMPSEDALKVNPESKTDGWSTAYRIINDPVDSELKHKTRPIADAWVVLK